MSVQEKAGRMRKGQAVVLLGVVLLLVLSAGLGACGGSDDGKVTAAKARPPAPCRPGGQAASHVPDAPASWTNGPRPAIALTCSYDRVDSGAAIVGYPFSGGGSCVTAYSSSLGKTFGELCVRGGKEWTSRCERRGCVHYFEHRADSTVLTGMVVAAVSGVWASVNGKQVFEGVVLTNVYGKRLRAIGGREPFGFFSVYIPRCVEPDEVKVHLVTGGSKQIGLADEWDVVESKCPTGSSGRS